VRTSGIETQQRIQAGQLVLILLIILGSGDVLRSRRGEDREVEFFEHNRSGSKRPLSTALVDGPIVEGEEEPSLGTAGFGPLAAL
jgi:hypothetical protein